MQYQVKKFTCKKCGVNFDIESDSSIQNQELCNCCKYKKDGEK